MAEPLNLPAEAFEKSAPSESLRVKVRRSLDGLMQGLSVGGALTMVGLLAALIIVLVVGSYPAMRQFGFGFITGNEWDPELEHSKFGSLVFIYGTVASALVALCLAVPMSIGAALFLTRIAPKWLSGPVAFLIELLAAIPSIVFGFWGVKSLIPFLANSPFGQSMLEKGLGWIPYFGVLFTGPKIGFSMLAAGIVLAIMVTPIITSVARDVLLTIPKDIEEGAYALGATWWQSSLAILNYGKLGILGAVILGFARAIGETMAVAMVIGQGETILTERPDESLYLTLFGSGQTIATKLVNEFQGPTGPLHTSALTYLALVLLVLTLALNFLARMLVNSIGHDGKQKSKVKLAALPTSKIGTAAEPAAPSAPVVLRDIPIAKINYTVRYVNVVFKTLCVTAAMIAIAFLVMIFGYVVLMGITSLSWDFFLLNPGIEGKEGMKNCIQGTMILVGTASAIGIPVGMLCGIYLAEYAKKSWYNDIIRLVVDVLAGTPSIIAGALAYELVITKFGHFPGLKLGNSGWGGAFALAFLMVPIIARTTEEMLRLVPDSYREASLALGGAKYQTILQVVLPAATSGIVTGIMLSIARVAGETAPLMFTIGGTNQDVVTISSPPLFYVSLALLGGSAIAFAINIRLRKAALQTTAIVLAFAAIATGLSTVSFDLSKPFPALTVRIWQCMDSTVKSQNDEAWAGMLVLIVMVTILSAAVRYVTRAKKAVKV